MRPIILVLLLLCVCNVYGATYYMRENGTAANVAAATGPCGTQANTMSIATHNADNGGADTLTSGDVINLCDDGSDFDVSSAAIILADGGLTYQEASGDTVTITGAVTLGAFAATGTNSEYKIALATDPKAVWDGSTYLGGYTFSTQDENWADQGGNVWGFHNDSSDSSTILFRADIGSVYRDNGAALTKLTLDADGTPSVPETGEYALVNAGTGTQELYIYDDDDTVNDNEYIIFGSLGKNSLANDTYWYDSRAQELYVKITGGGDPGADVTYLSGTSCFTATDIDSITISNITCQKVAESGIAVTATANLTGWTISGNTITNVGHEGISFDESAGVTVSSISITSNTITYWDRIWRDAGADARSNIASPLTSKPFGIGLGSDWVILGDFTSLTVKNNTLTNDDYDQTILHYSSGTSDAIFVVAPTSSTIEENTIETNAGHGIHISGGTSGTACTAVVRENKFPYTEDDCIWVGQCTTTNGIEITANVCLGSGDDCIDVDSTATVVGHAYVSNNTCVSFTDGCLDLTQVNAGVNFYNNLCYRTTACSSDGCIINGNGGLPVDTNSNFDNNIYYSSAEDITGVANAFLLGGVNSGSATDWATWLADANIDDANSLTSNPSVSTTTGIPSNGSTAQGAGSNECVTGLFEDVLETASSWPSSIITADMCPIGFSKWDIGAFRIDRQCQ